MKLAVIYDKKALKKEGDESTIYCSICGNKLRLGPYRVLFCPKCEVVGSSDVIIDSIMSCTHCNQQLTAKINFDGRITGRCETENCGDCWSMQDLCLIKLPKSILPDRGEDSYIMSINNLHEAKIISDTWIDVKTLDFCELKQEIFDCFLKTNPELVKISSSQTLINQALINAINLNYQHLKNMDTRRNMWYSISKLTRESGAKREIIVAVVEKFAEESCSYETKYYIRRCGQARFVHSDIYRWIMRQIKNKIDEDCLSDS